MPRFDNRDLAFDAPDGWEDRSVVAFEAPKLPGIPFATNVTLMRVETKPMTLATFATQQVANLASALPKFELASQRNVTFAGMPAIELLYHWQPPDGGITQRITVFQRGGKIWSFTASCIRGAFEQNVALFDKIASTIQFADAPNTVGAPLPHAAPPPPHAAPLPGPSHSQMPPPMPTPRASVPPPGSLPPPPFPSPKRGY